MSKSLEGLSVFFASPGGLEDERKAFKEVIDRVNRDVAHAEGCTFIPCGWEYVSAGVGRPQSLINEQVKDSDYLVVMLWDQWGRPPDDGVYTSGTEEEFNVALGCLQDPDMPMRDIVVLFKGVPKRQLADPGEGLRKVLAFKEKLEAERVLLYSTFDAMDEFKDDFRAHLHEWLRDWSSGSSPKTPVPSAASLTVSAGTVPSLRPPVVDGGPAGTALEQALAAVNDGRATEAEQYFAVATSGAYDGKANTEYVRFLRKAGRATLAEVTANSFLDAAKDAGDIEGEIEALSNLAIVKRQQGHNTVSLRYLDQATGLVDRWLKVLESTEDGDATQSALRTKAFLLDNRSLTLRRLPDGTSSALMCLDEAAELQNQTGDMRGAAYTWRNKGTLLMRLGRTDEAWRALTESVKLFRRANYASGEAAALGSLGELFEASGDYPKAIEELEESIAVNPSRSPGRMVMNYGALTRVYLKLGDVDAAADYSAQCDRLGRELGTPESLATGLHAGAQVSLARGDVSGARSALREAQGLYAEVNSSAGLAAVFLGLAKASVAEGKTTNAREELEEARKHLARAPHWAIEREVDLIAAGLPKPEQEGFQNVVVRASHATAKLPPIVRDALFEYCGMGEAIRPEAARRPAAEEARRDDLLYFDDELGGYCPNLEDPDVEEALKALGDLFDVDWGETIEAEFREKYRKTFNRASRPVWIALGLLT